MLRPSMCGLLLTACGASFLTPLPASAAAPAAPGTAPKAAVAFDIEAGSLEAALVAFAAQSHRQILFTPQMVAGHRAEPLKGLYAPEVALGQLLAGSGLVARRQGATTYVLHPEAEPAGSGPGNGAAVQPIATEGLAEAAPQAAAAPAVLDELVVTGSLIHGREALTSPLLQFDRDAIDRTGHATVADMLQALPQNFGGSGAPAASLLGTDPRTTNELAATGVNLRGLGAAATLVLVNGRRMAGVGSKGDFADVSAVPTAVVDHVDVLTDGASALYGSDAVGGVVNIVLKRRMDGWESRLHVGGSTQGGGEELTASQTYGTSWRSGSLVLAYEYGRHWRLNAADRPFTETSDLRALGGTDHRVFYAHPGNILVFNAATGAYVAGWAIPSGQTGAGLKPTDFIPGVANLENQRAGGDVLPSDHRHTFYAALTQDFGARVRLNADLRYNRRDNLIARPAPVSVFTVSRANPFYVAPNGAASETIGYSFEDEIGPSLSDGRAQSFGASAGLDVDLGRRWRGEVYAATALERGRRDTERLVNSRFVNEALGVIADDPATAYSAARDGYFNPFGDGGANAAAVLNFIGSGYTRDRTDSAVHTFDAKADGPVWQTPGGPILAALGVQAREERFKTSSTSLVSTSAPVSTGGLTFKRTIEAAFVELRVPLVGEGMQVPGVRRLELSGAVRREHYDDFGDTTNPKVGALWSPAQGVNVRASYGTSFRAPNLPELNQIQNASPVLVGSGASQTLALVQTGGNRDLRPEKARTFSFGLDLTPAAIPGLKVSATAFDVRFRDQIGQPVLSDIANALSNPAYAPFVQRLDPASATDLAKVKSVIAISTSSNIGLFPAEAYRALIDARFVNTGQVRVRGVDLEASYAWTRAADSFSVSGSATYLADDLRKVTPTAPAVQLVNVANQPARLRGRVTAAWGRGPFGASATLNVVNAYKSEAGRRIDAWTPLDLQLRWTSPSARGPVAGVTAALTIQNLFDQDPPFYDSPLGIGYDPANADPLGRYVALQLTKRW